MPEQVRQQQRPELGFTSVGQYLDANQGPLAAGFANARTEAEQLGSGFGPLFPAATPPPGGASPTGANAQPLGTLDSYLDKSNQAESLSTALSSRAGLQGSGRVGYGLDSVGPGRFNSALAFSKYGSQYQDLGKYLDQFSGMKVREAYPKPDEPPQPEAPKVAGKPDDWKPTYGQPPRERGRGEGELIPQYQPQPPGQNPEDERRRGGGMGGL